MKKSNKKIIVMFSALIALVLIFVSTCVVTINLPIVRYNFALQLIKYGQSQTAYKILYSLEDYKDNLKIMEQFTHNYTKYTLTQSDGNSCINEFYYHSNGNLKKEIQNDFDGSITETEYDINGNKIKYMLTEKDGTVSQHRTYEYNAKNQLVKETNLENDTPTTTIYEYDYKGNLIKQYDEEFPLFFTEYVYDTNGNITKIIDYNGEISDEYFYDDRGNMIQEKSYYEPGGELHIQYDYAYDENNNLIMKKGKDGDIQEGVYDSKGNLIKIIYKNEGSDSIDTVDIEYDTNGNIVKVVCDVFSNDNIFAVKKLTQYRFGMMMSMPNYVFNSDHWFYTNPKSTTEYTYDSNGNEIIKRVVDEDGNISETKSTYDKTGNLLKCVTTKNGKTTISTEYNYDAYGNLLKVIDRDSEGDIVSQIEYTDYIGTYKKD